MSTLKRKLKQAEDAAWNNYRNYELIEKWMIENGYLIMYSHDESDPLTPAKNIVRSLETLTKRS